MTQYPEIDFDKVSNTIHKTCIGQGEPLCFKDSKNVLHKTLANRAWKGQFWLTRHYWAESAVLASMALPCPIC